MQKNIIKKKTHNPTFCSSQLPFKRHFYKKPDMQMSKFQKCQTPEMSNLKSIKMTNFCQKRAFSKAMIFLELDAIFLGSVTPYNPMKFQKKNR